MAFLVETKGREVCRVFEKWPATPRCSWPAAWAWRPCIWSSWLRAPLDPLHLRHQARCQVLSCQEHQTWRTMAWSRLLCALEVAWCLALCCWPSDSPASLMSKMWWSLCLSRTWRLSGLPHVRGTCAFVDHHTPLQHLIASLAVHGRSR